MPIRRLVLLALLAVATSVLATAAAAPARSAAAAERCRGIDLGFTTAKVTAKRIGCPKARAVVQKWRQKAGDGPPPAHSRALGFDCHFGGSDLLVTLRCTRGDKVAKATWGG